MLLTAYSHLFDLYTMTITTWRDHFRKLQDRQIPWAHRTNYPGSDNQSKGTQAPATTKAAPKKKQLIPTGKEKQKSTTLPTHKVKSSAKWLFTLDNLVDVAEPKDSAHWRSWAIQIRAASLQMPLTQLSSISSLLDAQCPAEVNNWVNQRLEHWSRLGQLGHHLITEVW